METTIQQFLTYVRTERGYTDNTVSAYRCDLKQFQQFAQTRQVKRWEQLTPEVIQRFTAWLREQPYRKTTIARKIAAVRSFLSYLFTEGVLDQELLAWIPIPHTGRRLPRPLNHEEMRRLLVTSRQDQTPLGLRDAAILEFLYATGLRATETISLTIDNIDWERYMVSCQGKRMKERHVPLHEVAQESLRRYLDKGRPFLLRAENERTLFINRNGKPLTRQGLRYIIQRKAQQAGLPHITPHTLRHTFATHLLDGGAGIREIQYFLGHADITVTQLYTQVSDSHKREVYNHAHPRAFRKPSLS